MPLLPTVSGPPAVTSMLPLVLVTLPSVIASASVTVMLPLAVASRLAAARLRPIEPAAVAFTPTAATTPELVMAPPEVTVRLPLIVEAPRAIAPVSLSVTFLPLTTLTAPTKSLALLSVMSLAEPAVRVVVPVTVRAPLSVMAPPAAIVALPPTVRPVRLMADAAEISNSEPVVAVIDWAETLRMASPVAETVIAFAVTKPSPRMLPAVALSVASVPAVVVPLSWRVAPVSDTRSLAATLVATVRLPEAVTFTDDSLPGAATVPSVRSPLSVTRTLSLADVASSELAARLRLR